MNLKTPLRVDLVIRMGLGTSLEVIKMAMDPEILLQVDKVPRIDLICFG